MKQKNRLIAGALLSCCASTVFAKPMVVAVADPVGALKDQMCAHFVESVREEMPNVKLNFVQGEALGSAKSVMEQHISGSVDIFCNELVWFANYVNDMQVLGWGFTFRDAEHMINFFNSDLFMPLKEEAIQKGARILSAHPAQPRVLFTKAPVEGIDDIKNIKMRVPQLKSYLELWTAMGTKPTQVSWNEVYLGLSTGVIVAAEGPPTEAGKQRFHDAAPYVTRTDHLYSTLHISINETSWQGLSESEQSKLENLAKKATEWGMNKAFDELDGVLASFESDGATVSEIDKAPFQDAVKRVVSKVESDGLFREGLWNDIQKL